MTVYRRVWKNRNGRISRAWLVEVTVDGKRRRKQYPTQAAAFEAQAALKTPLAPARQRPFGSFETLAAAYVAELRSLGRERSTVYAYEGQLRRHVLPIIGRLPLHAMDRASGVAVMARLTEKLTREYAHVTFSAFRRLVKHAHDIGAIPTNPIAGLRFNASYEKRLGARRNKLRIPTKSEIALLLSRMEWGDGKLRQKVERADVVAALGLFAGLRPSETRGLRVQDVIEVDGAIYVSVAQRADNYGEIGAVKTPASLREVPIPRRVLELIRTYIRLNGVGPDGLILTAIGTAKPINYSNFVARDWPRFFDLEGEKAPMTLHELRHCYASLQIEQGIDPKTLQHRMGHSSIQTTLDIYGHLWADQVRDAQDAERYDAAMRQLQERHGGTR
jgi:integrase